MTQPKTKRKGKPKRLVKPEKTTREAQKIIDINAASSSLLRLAPETRNRIYALVLGGQDIHVYYDDRKKGVAHSLCEAAGPESTTAEARDTETTAPQHSFGWHKRHYACTRSYTEPSSPVPLNLSLLRVSKQVHQEAALLPFTLNTFIFRTLSDVGYFANQILVAQKLAIRNIDVHTDVCLKGCTKKNRTGITKLLGIRSLTFTLEGLTYHFDGPHGTSQVQRWLEEIKHLFGSMDLGMVDLYLRAFDTRVRDLAQETSLPKEYDELLREAKKALLDHTLGEASEEGGGNSGTGM